MQSVQKESKMLRVTGVICFIMVFTISGFAQTKPASRNEIQQTIKTINQFIEEGKENIVEIYNSAIEIEKRATNHYLANIIAKKIISASGISEKEFGLLRNNYSFSEIAIAWALSKIGKISIKKVFEEIKISTLEEVLEEYACGCEYVSSKIFELNPEKKPNSYKD